MLIINQTQIELTSLRPAAILFLGLILFFTAVSSKSANLQVFGDEAEKMKFSEDDSFFSLIIRHRF